MAQTKLDIKIADQNTANAVKEKGLAVAGVKFINVNIDNCIVVTHSDDFDEDVFKQAINV